MSSTNVLKWDVVGQRTYETGVKQCALYPQSSTGTYPSGVAWSGITSISESPTGADANPIYADDIKYLDLRAAEQFEASIEAYTYPDEFGLLDGTAAPATGVSIGQQVRKPFGLAYITTVGNDSQSNDYGYKVHLIYNATVSPSEKSYSTINDSPEAITFSWSLTTTPVTVNGYRPTSCVVIDSTKVNDEDKMKTLLDNLYGRDADTDNSVTAITAHLPSPDEVIAMFATA